MKTFKTGLLAAAIAAGMIGTTPAAAYDQGNFIVRAGPAGVYPTGDSEDITTGGVNLGTVEADSAWSLGITGTYMVTDVIGIGLLAAWPFEHDIDGDSGVLESLDTVAETKHLPPTLTAQYHFDLANPKVHPFVGAGINYTYFFDEDTKGALSGTDIDIDNSFGWALEAGLDYELENNWLVGAQVWYINIEPQAELEVTGKKHDVDINPWVVMFSVGRKF